MRLIYLRLPSVVLLVAFMFLTSCTEPTKPKTEAPKNPNAEEVMKLPPRANTEVRPSPNASITETIATTHVTLTYGRPGVKGRKIFGGLEEYGKVWRAGANEATVFAISRNVKINGQLLPKGVYGFFLLPTAKEWTIIFNKQADQWGAFNYNAKLDALRIPVKPETGSKQEWLSYSFDELKDASAKLTMSWDTVRISMLIETAN